MATGNSENPHENVAVNTAVLLREAYTAVDRIVPVRLAQQGHGTIRVAHGAVLQHLDDSGTTVSTLAERAGMTKQAMAELVQYLERHAYVRRMPDPHDQRAKLVQVTDKGREVIAIARSLAPELERRLIDALGRSRWRELRKDLQTIHEIFEHDPAAR